MRADIDRWNAKYASPGEHAPMADAVLAEQCLSGPGVALDLACGRGGNVGLLLRWGFEVVAVDGSIAGLREARRWQAESTARWVCADLDQFVLPSEKFDLVVVTRYLNRGLVEAIRDCIKPEGWVFYRTFNRGHLRKATRFNPDYVLRPGELQTWFHDFEIASYVDDPDTATQSHVLARRVVLAHRT